MLADLAFILFITFIELAGDPDRAERAGPEVPPAECPLEPLWPLDAFITLSRCLPIGRV